MKTVGELTKSDDEAVSKQAKIELNCIKSRMGNLLDYVNVVDHGEVHQSVLEFHLDGKTQVDAKERAEKARSKMHEVAIAAADILNRSAARHCNSVIFTGDSTDRLAVADFCLDVTVKLFNERRIVS